MRLTVEPPIDRWRLRERPEGDRAVGVIATGHQASLWHPGILAKYIAMQVAAQRFGASTKQVVVDQDAHEALKLTVPVERNGRLSVVDVQLADDDSAIPTGCQPPVDPAKVLATLGSGPPGVAVDSAALIDAYTDLPPCTTLAQQTSTVLDRLMSPYLTPAPKVFASDLLQMPDAQRWLRRMIEEAQVCVTAYNRAVAAHPEAGVAPLLVERDRVELPIWLLRWGRPRRRVYADLADSSGGERLTTADGETIALDAAGGDLKLAPRAVMLTAVVRTIGCDLFIHGKGGAVYDRVTQQWWQDWLSEQLAPIAVVSADVELDLDVPMADAAAVDRAAWWAHHLPHNLDRALDLDGAAVRRKRQLLAQMNDDQDRTRRAAAFAELHRINAAFAVEHRDAVNEAQDQLDQVRIGAANRKIADRRDWCFALYRPRQLDALVQALSGLGQG